MPDPPVVASIDAPLPPAPIDAPRPPATPAQPAQPSPPAAPWSKSEADKFADTLVKELDKDHRADVLTKLQKLPSKLPSDQLGDVDDVAKKRHASELRRIIRFVRWQKSGFPSAKPPADQAPVKPKGLGKPKIQDRVRGGTVEAYTDVMGSTDIGGGDIKQFPRPAFSFSFKGRQQAVNKRWLQFVWRRIEKEFSATSKGKTQNVPVAQMLQHPSRAPIKYFLTIDPKRTSWNTDTSSNDSPFFEKSTDMVNRSDDELTMFDPPDAVGDVVSELFKSDPKPTRVFSRFHATTYLVDNMDVLYRFEVDVTWEFTSATEPSPTMMVKGYKETELAPAHRARLVLQFPEADYLPGKTLDPPDPLDEFDLGKFSPVRDRLSKGTLTEAKWAEPKPKGLNDLVDYYKDRYEDVATIAQANWINDIISMTPGRINTATDPTPVSGEVKRGLNFSMKLTGDAEGETGYIGVLGGQDVYENPGLPRGSTGTLPHIAIILSAKAFDRGRPLALATMRHEMRHAAHEQLAIRWRLKWLDDYESEASFTDWLKKQLLSKLISEVDFALVSGYLYKNLAATETLAWIEGLLAGLTFLPPTPILKDMSAEWPTTGKVVYPAAIAELKGAGKHFNAVSTDAIKEAAIEEVHDFCCRNLSQSERDTFVHWIKVLSDPSHNLEPAPGNDKEKKTVERVEADFRDFKRDFLKRVLAAVQKPCSK